MFGRRTSERDLDEILKTRAKNEQTNLESVIPIDTPPAGNEFGFWFRSSCRKQIEVIWLNCHR